ncbi:hypothetical protein NDU88_001112 [Pleurodeles waltl]|uniref:Uncharacterized protein n=1 Tax=Pleurodeles waltl TaxID=8319 RepID=A0AAV7LXR5_PLEWA|nr:hypothetical protein NDU88_001112 [Pleurodeles waltl]
MSARGGFCWRAALQPGTGANGTPRPGLQTVEAPSSSLPACGSLRAPERPCSASRRGSTHKALVQHRLLPECRHARPERGVTQERAYELRLLMSRRQTQARGDLGRGGPPGLFGK